MAEDHIRKMREMYPRPRVGQHVRTRKQKRYEVIAVRSARDVLRGMMENQAHGVGPTMEAKYGKGWLDTYFEAECIAVGSPRVVVLTPMDIEEIMDDI